MKRFESCSPRLFIVMISVPALVNNVRIYKIESIVYNAQPAFIITICTLLYLCSTLYGIEFRHEISPFVHDSNTNIQRLSNLDAVNNNKIKCYFLLPLVRLWINQSIEIGSLSISEL